MPAFLSQEWLDHLRRLGEALPERPGASARLQIVVTGGPDGEVRYLLGVENGRIAELALGSDDRVDATVTQPYEDARLIALGELDLPAAFMQGRVKVTGSMGSVMAIMPVLQSREYAALVEEVAAATDA